MPKLKSDKLLSGLIRDFAQADYPEVMECRLVLADYVEEYIDMRIGKAIRYFPVGFVNGEMLNNRTYIDQKHLRYTILPNFKRNILNVLNDYGKIKYVDQYITINASAYFRMPGFAWVDKFGTVELTVGDTSDDSIIAKMFIV